MAYPVTAPARAWSTALRRRLRSQREMKFRGCRAGHPADPVLRAFPVITRLTRSRDSLLPESHTLLTPHTPYSLIFSLERWTGTPQRQEIYPERFKPPPETGRWSTAVPRYPMLPQSKPTP